MQNLSSKFFQNSFQFLNFTFVYFNPLSFWFIQKFEEHFKNWKINYNITKFDGKALIE